jgi:hypothetical protein
MLREYGSLWTEASFQSLEYDRCFEQIMPVRARSDAAGRSPILAGHSSRPHLLDVDSK